MSSFGHGWLASKLQAADARCYFNITIFVEWLSLAFHTRFSRIPGPYDASSEDDLGQAYIHASSYLDRRYGLLLMDLDWLGSILEPGLLLT